MNQLSMTSVKYDASAKHAVTEMLQKCCEDIVENIVQKWRKVTKDHNANESVHLSMTYVKYDAPAKKVKYF